MSQVLVEGKQVVVDLVRFLARGRAVELIWWERSDDSLTLYLEGRLEDGVSSRTSHRFERDTLERLSEHERQSELLAEMRRIVAPFARRTRRRVGGAAHKHGFPTPPPQ